MEQEESWNGIPSNLSDILKRAQEAQAKGIENILASREELMEIKQFINPETDGAERQEQFGNFVINETIFLIPMKISRRFYIEK
jgi:hypothetical protein